ncbi:glycerol dehydratase reactivase beta/small subunit family protein [Mycobacterium yunnanensis]|uniref:Glycerol dehydratase reactivase beta/small subunit family protein n=1 Tax=Mycobacterium yunnanensis TaxID=368477 RepID=A0A9X3C1U8_9MYCO|nr:glycerol dehydratase reactivase beta/small subunit family protein [Mycobacterium yunnanensis]
MLVLSVAAGPVEDEVLAGMEEEGVPSVVERPRHGDDDAITLATTAAGRSSLAVGVGIDAGGRVCVQHDKLPDPLPELYSSGPADGGTARSLGHDAARIVVGIPLRAERLS